MEVIEDSVLYIAGITENTPIFSMTCPAIVTLASDFSLKLAPPSEVAVHTVIPNRGQFGAVKTWLNTDLKSNRKVNILQFPWDCFCNSPLWVNLIEYRDTNLYEASNRTGNFYKNPEPSEEMIQQHCLKYNLCLKVGLSLIRNLRTVVGRLGGCCCTVHY